MFDLSRVIVMILLLRIKSTEFAPFWFTSEENVEANYFLL